jgi:thiol-disulfide isomerase/thioredoxin
MKFKLYTAVLVGLLAMACSCQTNSDNIATTDYDSNSALAGEKEDYRLNRSILNRSAWFTEGYKSYLPNTEAVSRLHDANKNLSFVVFGGSWCSDTKKALPKFYKVIEQAEIPAKKVMLYGVDRDKNSLEKDGSKRQSKYYHINHVPTFIVFYNGKEIGRLDEIPDKSIEQDLVDLIAKF